MRRTPFCAFLISVACFSFVPRTGAQMTTARVSMNQVGGLEIVQVLVNGTGPYDFILDTGANITVIKRPLLRSLNIPDNGRDSIVTAGGASPTQRATVNSIAIGGLSVEHLEVAELDGATSGSLAGRVQGILGENFLRISISSSTMSSKYWSLTEPQTSRIRWPESICKSHVSAASTLSQPQTESLSN